ncbi:C40 family peptidase [Desulfonema magnum]|uniref:Endopeptidase, NLPC/P60 n=1 Tax=Desulfonema magnum TaxID=45655 RepID=A0A975BHS1_9BACT|nr:NlpC/P60 family protein [Desulfonema magnum]QTA85270.1 putative endopeptidase, NLPC/P60 [Desulfonema magnum]
MFCSSDVRKRLLFLALSGGAAVFFLFITAGCAPSPYTLKTIDHPHLPKNIEEYIRSEVREWEGTPHQWGGTSRKGTDCSGFVMIIYKTLFNIRLPRSTKHQIRTGVQIPKSQLQAGDLVFFLLPENMRHVGIYLGKGEFAHTSGSKSVMISHMDDCYWRNTYETSRRILPYK